ncbi:hypothetical protein AVEN_165353-1 [Araneus ventricosus]|uniref:Uncharacterized protein n=1 Tax=Araneus ventricosus TaxID=182803 RepID=A0A4Y2ATI1_ARAVE|nr:hypothetical protein AVEN_165353-1 [Araneus ventricosus]
MTAARMPLNSKMQKISRETSFASKLWYPWMPTAIENTLPASFGSYCPIPVVLRRCNQGTTGIEATSYISILLELLQYPRYDTLPFPVPKIISSAFDPILTNQLFCHVKNRPCESQE